jgi:hypothetical protein
MSSGECAWHWKRSFRVAAGAAALLLLISVESGRADDPGPFAGLEGGWNGTGTISLTDGTKERMRCRNQYIVTNAGTNLQQALLCNSDSYEFHVNTYVNADPSGALSGSWTEVTRNVSGQVSGNVGGGKISVSVGPVATFSATMTITTTGDKQSVQIAPKGTDVALVSVSLTRGR